ncbi:hypothetical protein ASD76_08955 [Altererythrobacter sp. Root672]|nr:hypothetical protein ASD76_08955 [Altererythrobacter sp. Root672]
MRRQASGWLAKLNGPHDERDWAAFAAWYHASPDHAASFDRLSALFETAAEMRPSRVSEPEWREPRRIPAYAFVAAAAIAGGVIVAFAVLSARPVSPRADPSTQLAVFSAALDASSLVHLADGSDVELAPGSRLNVDIDSNERRLRLERGEGRFVVKHEGRPFIVTAEQATIVARGTEFRVRLGAEGTLVSLIEGRIDVSYATSRQDSGRRMAQLTAGQHLMVPTAPPEDGPTSVATGRTTMIEFNDTRLDEAVEQINRNATPGVRLADPELARLRVTGAFEAGDARAFARSVAAALSLHLVEEPDGSLGLQREGAAQ